MRISRLSGSFIINWLALAGAGGFCTGEMSKAAYNVCPSGENALPPWFDCKLKFVPGATGYGAFARFNCASTRSVAVSNRFGPHRKRVPSSETETTFEEPSTARERSTVFDAV